MKEHWTDKITFWLSEMWDGITCWLSSLWDEIKEDPKGFAFIWLLLLFLLSIPTGIYYIYREDIKEGTREVTEDVRDILKDFISKEDDVWGKINDGVFEIKGKTSDFGNGNSITFTFRCTVSEELNTTYFILKWNGDAMYELADLYLEDQYENILYKMSDNTLLEGFPKNHSEFVTITDKRLDKGIIKGTDKRLTKSLLEKTEYVVTFIRN